jgi:hypothetical protein
MDSLHGLVRGENMELGRDSDTGGQVTGGRSNFFYLKMKQICIPILGI